MGFYASWAEGTYNGQRCISKLWFGQKFFNWAFEYIFLHLFFNRQRFQADGILIPNLHKALSVIGNAADVYNQNPFSEIYKTEDFAKSPRSEFVFQFCILSVFSISTLFSILAGGHLAKSIGSTGFSRQILIVESLQQHRFTL
jgi:hypothetical protein